MDINLSGKSYFNVTLHNLWEDSIKDDIVNKNCDILIIEIEGSICKNKKSLMNEMAKKLNFPCYFSHNWDSFDECLNDLEWLEFIGLIIVFKNTEYLLVNELDELDNFYDLILQAAIEWNETIRFGESRTLQKIFHLIFTTDNVDLLQDKLKAYRNR